jgi:hypothetical protein
MPQKPTVYFVDGARKDTALTVADMQQDEQITWPILFGLCAHTIRDKDLGNIKSGGRRCPRMAQAISQLRGGSPKSGSGENLETSTKP